MCHLGVAVRPIDGFTCPVVSLPIFVDSKDKGDDSDDDSWIEENAVEILVVVVIIGSIIAFFCCVQRLYKSHENSAEQQQQQNGTNGDVIEVNLKNHKMMDGGGVSKDSGSSNEVEETGHNEDSSQGSIQ